MARHTWTIDFKDFIKFKNKEKNMEEIDLTPELKDLIARYEKDIKECQEQEELMMNFVSSYMEAYLVHRNKRIQTQQKLYQLNRKIAENDEGDDE